MAHDRSCRLLDGPVGLNATVRPIPFECPPSERSAAGGRLRIAPVPVGQCTYSCVYCRLGGTGRPRTRPRPFRTADELVSEVRERVARLEREGTRPELLVFAHGGEPTLDSRLGIEIERLSAGDQEVVVMTNASLLWRPEVRARLMDADRVVVKVDAVDAAAWRRLNRPVRQLRLDRVLTGLERFRAEYHGWLDTRTTLVPGVNDSPAQLAALATFLETLAPIRVLLAGKGDPEAFRNLGLHFIERRPCAFGQDDAP
jgi:wyosine [tRNA(Phe)-imidazoG37] synthetase (radical SAM superfamily)